jgi:molecular chaperone DnaK (HSP70)
MPSQYVPGPWILRAWNHRRGLRATAVITCTALLAPALARAGGIDDAYNSNYQTIRKLAKIINDAGQQKDRDTMVNQTMELKENAHEFEEKIYRSADRFAEEDKKWWKEQWDGSSKVSGALGQLRVATQQLNDKAKKVGESYSSELNSFKSAVERFYKQGDEFFKDLTQHSKHLQERSKKFKDEWSK